MSCIQCGGKTSGWDFCEGCEWEIRQQQELEAAIQEEAARQGAEAERMERETEYLKALDEWEGGLCA